MPIDMAARIGGYTLQDIQDAKALLAAHIARGGHNMLDLFVMLERAEEQLSGDQDALARALLLARKG